MASNDVETLQRELQRVTARVTSLEQAARDISDEVKAIRFLASMQQEAKTVAGE